MMRARVKFHVIPKNALGPFLHNLSETRRCFLYILAQILELASMIFLPSQDRLVWNKLLIHYLNSGEPYRTRQLLT